MITVHEEEKKFQSQRVKDELRQQIAAQTEDFLARGGKIDRLGVVIKSGASAVGENQFVISRSHTMIHESSLKYLTNNQASEYLRINRQSLVTSQRTGKLLGIKAPKCLTKDQSAAQHYRRSELDRWLKKAERERVYSQ